MISASDNRTYRYTISTNSWERLADLPFGVGYYVGCRLGFAEGYIYASARDHALSSQKPQNGLPSAYGNWKYSSTQKKPNF
jgi:hypothetical protein